MWHDALMEIGALLSCKWASTQLNAATQAWFDDSPQGTAAGQQPEEVSCPATSADHVSNACVQCSNDAVLAAEHGVTAHLGSRCRCRAVDGRGQVRQCLLQLLDI